MLNTRLSQHADLLDSLRDVLHAAEPEQSLETLLREMQPYDLSEILLHLDYKEQLLFLGTLAPEIAAETLEFLEPDDQYGLLDHLGPETSAAILNDMSSDAVVQLFTAIHPLQREQLMGALRQPYQEQICTLLSYPENTAGSLAAVDYIAARQWWTTEQTLAHLRKVGSKAEIITYIYVLEPLGELVGVLSLRDLIMAPPGTALAEIMNTKTVSVSAAEDQEKAARLLAQYNLVALPVVSSDGKMVGILTVDDVLDVIEEEATEDIHLLGGSQPLDSPYLNVGFFKHYRKRVIWLLVLFVAEAFTGNILRHFEGFLTQMVALAFFIPLLIDTGGNAGSQTSTMIIRAMAVGELRARDFFTVIWREARLGLLLGLTMAAVAFARALFLDSSFPLGYTVAATIIAVVTLSSIIGAVMPMLGNRLGLDPAVFSAPLITTVVDATGLMIYFQMARWMMQL